MIGIILTQVLGILTMATVAILLIIYGYKEYKLRKKIELLTHIIDKGYETENVDINNL